MTGAPSVAVVVVAYNSAGDLHRCLTSLLSATRAPTLSVVVVDNASSDDSVARARAVATADPRVRVVANAVNVGFGAACNQGVATVDSDFVVLLNPDTITHDGAIDALVATAARDARLGPVGGRTVDAAGRLDPRSVQRAPAISSLLVWALAVPLWARLIPFVGFWARHPRLGGFDERFFLYAEDVDLSLPARAAGLVPTYTPEATITHAWGSSSATFGRKLVGAMRGRSTLFRRHWSPRRARVGIALLLLGVATRATAERLARRPGSWSEAFAARREWLPGWPEPAESSDQRNGSAA